MPITRTATVSRFEWERTVAIEEYRNVDESDWFLPQKANLHETKEAEASCSSPGFKS